jgi:hypothetical protein
VVLREGQPSKARAPAQRSRGTAPPLMPFADQGPLRFLIKDQVGREFVSELDGRFFVIRCYHKECERNGSPKKFKMDPMKRNRMMNHVRQCRAHVGEEWTNDTIIESFSYDSKC